ncbi:MAG: hypothetical protein R3B90_17620 [Planctomycetaceae bacterium]
MLPVDMASSQAGGHRGAQNHDVVTPLLCASDATMKVLQFLGVGKLAGR